MTEQNIFKNGFYYIEDAAQGVEPGVAAMFTVTLMAADSSQYGPEHDPWLLNKVLYEVRNDYEVFCKVAWLDADNIEQVLRGLRLQVDEEEEHQEAEAKISYCITNGTIKVPANLFENPSETIDEDEDYIDQMEELLNKIEDDNGVAGSSINDQIHNFTREPQWGQVVRLI
jgi:hypothetical protein